MSSALIRFSLGCKPAVTASRRALLQCQLSRWASASSGQDGSKGPEKAPLKKAFTPAGKHDAQMPEKHRDAEKEPLAPFPDDINPETGEKGGPRGLEPTRYGDWERKGRCIDF